MIQSWLALGDSYTIGEGVPEGERYAVQTIAQLKDKGIHFSNPQIIATTGWTTADLLRALNKALPEDHYDIVSLLIGVNNQYQGRSQAEYETEFTELLQRSILLAGNRPGHVIVLSIPDYSVTPFGQRTGQAARITAEIDAFNAVNKKISVNFGVNYVDITAESRKAAGDPGLIAEDELHYSGKAYARWASLLSPRIGRIIAG